ncbi:hypothetical protein BIW11_04593 [Tropilaelaps mercedesae]|uniref:Uncharacterized protein n=1 Tax=Tropilaelaps mercedesae TaxID=418985 RepID=A0A1V9X3W8_9ACAR|nr:hypothetical protein BIW11_04593 [Tropilaelaps mercedesae]
MADLEAVLADVSYLMAMEKSKSTPAARASKKIVLPDPRYVGKKGNRSSSLGARPSSPGAETSPVVATSSPNSGTMLDSWEREKGVHIWRWEPSEQGTERQQRDAVFSYSCDNLLGVRWLFGLSVGQWDDSCWPLMCL